MKKSDKYALLILEKYRTLSRLSAAEAYKLFDEKKIFDYIDDAYEALHTQDTNLVVKEIAKLVKK